jgi:serine/threonine protein kinase
MALRSGTKVRSLELNSLLGSGGSGEFYRTRDTKLSTRLALKVLPEALRSNGERISRFRCGAQVRIALDHPHIAAYYGLKEVDVPRLVMELVEGMTLLGPLRAVPRPFSHGRSRAFDRPTKVTLSPLHPKSGEDRWPCPQAPN